MELKDLVGFHRISAVDTVIETVQFYEWSKNTEECNVIRFVLDGITYKLAENHCDGYRSHYGNLIVCEEPITNNFPPQEVMAKMKENENYIVNEILQFTDIITGKIVLEIGTANTDDYYPYCVMNWNPENLAINANNY